MRPPLPSDPLDEYPCGDAPPPPPLPPELELELLDAPSDDEEEEARLDAVADAPLAALFTVPLRLVKVVGRSGVFGLTRV